MRATYSKLLRHHRRRERPGADDNPISLDDPATISPYITHTIRRFGIWTPQPHSTRPDPHHPSEPGTTPLVRFPL